MRINCHAHIFNLQSILTTRTLETVINRITEFDLPEFVKKVLKDELSKVIAKAEPYADEEQLLRNIVNKLTGSKEYKDILKGLTKTEKTNLDIINIDQLDNLAVKGLMSFFQWFGKQLFKGDEDYKKATVADAIDWLRIALQPSIRKVTDNLMEQLEEDDAVVALMMDITKDGSEKEQFANQIADTSSMVLAYPGRIFPFVAVNTNRPDHFKIMTRALESNGFTGVKLYPSLGYDINSKEMDTVFEYCASKNIPLLSHCTNKGFYFRDEDRNNASPALWRPILKKWNNLIICFGHFGGAGDLSGTTSPEELPNDSWTKIILDLMVAYPGVYADISFHDKPMTGEKYEKHYFRNFRRLMKHEVYRDRLLFGTDYFLVRTRLTEENYWKYFKDNISEKHFVKITEQNPPGYLGFGKAGAPRSEAIERYARFVYERKEQIERGPASWLVTEVQDIFGESVALPLPDLAARWSWNNDAHFRTWSFMKRQMYPRHSKLKFKDTGRLRLRQMQYWNKEQEAKEIWNQKVRAMAENMDSEFRANNVKYEKGYNMKKAINHLEDEFDKGDLALFELAAICDEMYKFEKEV